MTYIRYSRGYRSGTTFNGGLIYVDEGDDAYVDPEIVDAYEICMKAEFFDRSVCFNTAAFCYNYTDQQFVNQARISVVMGNAGSADIYGMEAELL